MRHLLQRHASLTKAHLRASLVLAYAVPTEVLTPLLPPGLQLDPYGDHGFLDPLHPSRTGSPAGVESRPVAVQVHRNTFLQQQRFRDVGAVLANAFYLDDVPYAWKPGIREVLPQ